MRLRNLKVRRARFARSTVLIARKLQSNKLVFARMGLALAGSLVLGALPAFAENPDTLTRHEAWQQFALSNPGADHKELRQLFNVQWKSDRGFQPRSIAQPIFENSSVTQPHHLDASANTGVLRQESRDAERALRLQQKEEQQLLNQTTKEERQAQNLIKQSLQDDRQVHKTMQQISPQKFVNVNGRISLDLDSAIENITLGDKLFQNEDSITISVGGQTKTVSAGSKVTAAEYVAAKQVLAAGGQTLDIDSNGRAVGGEVDLSALTSGNQTLRVKDLSIPVAVTAAGDFGKGGDVRISGDLLNSGSIVAYSSEKNVQSASIFADNITNSQTGSITSQLNSVAQSHGGVVGDLNLSLHADDSLTNYGLISSAGDLTLTAGSSVQNIGDAGTVSAMRDVIISAPNVVNHGLIQSLINNVNIAAPSGENLNIISTAGSVNALAGDINIGIPGQLDKLDTTILGGSWNSRSVNIDSAKGKALLVFDSVSGLVNAKGGEGQVFALQGDLNVGVVDFSGDPLYVAANDLNLSSFGYNLSGAPLTFVAGRDINYQVPAPLPPDVIPPPWNPISISTDAATVGGPITIIAGAAYEYGLSSGFFVTGPSATGGNVNLSGVSSISAQGSQYGGNINIVAYGGNGRGNVDLRNCDIYTGGTTSSGRITVIAGGIDSAINLKSANIADGIPYDGIGRITIANAAPTGTYEFDKDTGAPQWLYFQGYSYGSRTNGTIEIGSINTGSSSIAAVTVEAGASATLGSITTFRLIADVAGTLTATDINAARTSLTGNLVNLSGDITATNGLVVVSRTDVTASAGTQISSRAAVLVAGAEYDPNITSIQIQDKIEITGVSASGGNVDLSAVSSFSTLIGSGAYPVTLIAYRGAGGGKVITPLTGGIYTAAEGGNFNGSVVIAAGANSSDAIQINSSITTGSGGGLNETGRVTLSAVQPLTGYDITTENSFSSISGNFLGSSPESGGIQLKAGITTQGALITLNAGGAVTGTAFGCAHLQGGPVDITADSIGTGIGADSIGITNGANPMSLNLHTISGDGQAYMTKTGTGLLTLKDSSVGGFNLDSESAVLNTGTFVSTFDISIRTNHLTNTGTLISSGANVFVRSHDGSGLTIDGQTGGTFMAANSINIIATNNDLTLQGKTTYNNRTELVTLDDGASIHLADGSESIALETSYLVTSNLDFQGTGKLTTFTPPIGASGDTWVLSNPGRTLANLSSTGSGTVTLSGAINLSGLNLAIIAGANIDLSAVTSIDLGSATDGGSLTMMAGYNFSPSTNGQQISSSVIKFINFAANSGGGNIIGGNTQITTTGDSGKGGAVIAIANGGSDYAGTISLGDINASGGTTGGEVLLIAEGGLNVGSIDTTGSSAADAGKVTLAVASASLHQHFSVQNGTAKIDGGTIIIIPGPPPPPPQPLVAVGPASSGDLTFSTINAGSAVVSLTGALNSLSDTIIGSGTISAGALTVNSGSGTAGIGDTAVGTLNSVASGSSLISLNNTGNLALGTVTGANQSLAVATSGQMTHGSGTIIIGHLNLTANTFNLSGGTIGAGGVSDITIESYTTLNGSSLGVLQGGEVRLVQVDSITDGAITNGITATNLTLHTTGAGSNIGTSADNRFILQANQSAVTAISDHGSVFLTTALPATSTLSVSGSAGGANGHFDILGTGNVRVGNVSTVDGDINIGTPVNRITLAAGAILDAHGVTAGNGDITLRVTDTSKNAKKTSFITIQNGAKLLTTTPKAGDGVITLSLGAPAAPVVGKAPKKNVIVNPSTGTIFWGKQGATFNAPTTNLTATGTNIVFNNNLNKKNMVVSGATFVADPPVAPGTPTWSYLAPNITARDGSTLPSDPVLQSDSSLLPLRAQQAAQLSSSSTLLTQSSASSTLSNTLMNDSLKNYVGVTSSQEDNSYMVGYMGSEFGETDAAVCSDAEVSFSALQSSAQQSFRKIPHADCVSIGHEKVLFIPFKDVTVQTPNGIVHIDAKSVCLISSTEAGLAVYDLEDQHKGSVRVESNGHNVILSPGRHVMITKHHTAEFGHVNAVETIAHRNIQSVLKNGHRAHTSEFSVMTAMDTVKPLKAMIASKHPQAKHIAARMMKTTAIILQMGGNAGQYQHYFKPRLTAKM